MYCVFIIFVLQNSRVIRMSAYFSFFHQISLEGDRRARVDKKGILSHDRVVPICNLEEVFLGPGGPEPHSHPKCAIPYYAGSPC